MRARGARQCGDVCTAVVVPERSTLSGPAHPGHRSQSHRGFSTGAEHPSWACASRSLTTKPSRLLSVVVGLGSGGWFRGSCTHTPTLRPLRAPKRPTGSARRLVVVQCRPTTSRHPKSSVSTSADGCSVLVFGGFSQGAHCFRHLRFWSFIVWSSHTMLSRALPFCGQRVLTAVAKKFTLQSR